MARLRRHRPTPSMVVACIALVIALGGTGYAATVLPKNSVGTAQVKNYSLLNQDFGITLTGKPSAGAYILDFAAPITGKLILASSANAGDVGDRGTVSAGPCGGTPDGSICPAANDANHARVITRKEGDSIAEDHPFYIAVVG